MEEGACLNQPRLCLHALWGIGLGSPAVRQNLRGTWWACTILEDERPSKIILLKRLIVTVLLARSVPSIAKVREEPLSLGSVQSLVQPQMQVLLPQRISPVLQVPPCECCCQTSSLCSETNETFPTQNSWHHALQQGEVALSWIFLLPSSFFLGPLPSWVLWLFSTIDAALHYWHIIVIHRSSAGLLSYVMVLHQRTDRWQEPQTQRHITFLSFMGCFLSLRQ